MKTTADKISGFYHVTPSNIHLMGEIIIQQECTRSQHFFYARQCSPYIPLAHTWHCILAMPIALPVLYSHALSITCLLCYCLLSTHPLLDAYFYLARAMYKHIHLTTHQCVICIKVNCPFIWLLQMNDSTLQAFHGTSSIAVFQLSYRQLTNPPDHCCIAIPSTTHFYHLPKKEIKPHTTQQQS